MEQNAKKEVMIQAPGPPASCQTSFLWSERPLQGLHLRSKPHPSCFLPCLAQKPGGAEAECPTQQGR